MTIQDLKKELDDFKLSLRGNIKLTLAVCGMILMCMQGCTSYYIYNNDGCIEKNETQIEIIEGRTYQNELALTSLQQDIKYIRDITNRIETSTSESLIRLDGKMDNIGQKLIELELKIKEK